MSHLSNICLAKGNARVSKQKIIPREEKDINPRTNISTGQKIYQPESEHINRTENISTQERTYQPDRKYINPRANISTGQKIYQPKSEHINRTENISIRESKYQPDGEYINPRSETSTPEQKHQPVNDEHLLHSKYILPSSGELPSIHRLNILLQLLIRNVLVIAHFFINKAIRCNLNQSICNTVHEFMVVRSKQNRSFEFN